MAGDDLTCERPTPFLCFAGQDWWYHNRAHSDFQLMLAIARERRVLVVNSLGMRMPRAGRSTRAVARVLRKLRSTAHLLKRPVPELPNFAVLSPLLIPLYGNAAMRRVNARLVALQVKLACRWLRIESPHCVVTVPTAADVVPHLRIATLHYYRADNHAAADDIDSGLIRRLEDRLISSARTVIYSSSTLLERERDRVGVKGVFLDHGVDVELFDPDRQLPTPADMAMLPRPRVGMLGAIEPYGKDLDLLEAVAIQLPEVTVVLIGTPAVEMGRFLRHPNVRWLGQKPHDAVPAYGKSLDVALLPVSQTEFGWATNPIKLKEYLALGLPVVSSWFPEVERFRDLVYVARGMDEFVQFVQKAIDEQGPTTAIDRRARIADMTWTRQAARLIILCEANERPA